MRDSLGRRITTERMQDRTKLYSAHAVTAVSLTILAYWIVVLRPFLTHTGPAPGAGAQYVFVLLPTLALATIGCLASAWIGERILRRDRSLLTPFNGILVALAGFFGLWLLILFGLGFIRASRGEL